MNASGAVRCPACGGERPPGERFCPDCGLPLVLDSGAPEEAAIAGSRHERARKVKPQLGEGPLVRVAGASNQAEGEFIQGLLLEEGVPSLLRRSAGFDVPDFLAAGPRDVLVPQSGASIAREVLLQAELVTDAPQAPVVRPVALALGLLVALAVGALVIWLAGMLSGSG